MSIKKKMETIKHEIEFKINRKLDSKKKLAIVQKRLRPETFCEEVSLKFF